MAGPITSCGSAKAQATTSQYDNARKAGLCLTQTVANGKVYVGAKREVDVYGILPATNH
jgi:hypothetical protein